MEKNERETLIVLNEADLAGGYFIFGTSVERHFTKLCKRVGGESGLLEVKKSTRGGVVTYWACMVPKKFLLKANFGIRKVSDPRSKRGPSVRGPRGKPFVAKGVS